MLLSNSKCLRVEQQAKWVSQYGLGKKWFSKNYNLCSFVKMITLMNRMVFTQINVIQFRNDI